MRFYNSLTGKKEEFYTLEKNKVKMYVCGPTVYDYFHLGNARCFIIFEALRGFFEYMGYEVLYVQNFTDIDDKMIKKAAAEGTTVAAVAEKYIKEYETDARGLNIRTASFHPRATENIDGIIEIISTLIDKGHAYVSNGDVYFRAKTFSGYGKLSHQPLEELESGARVDVSEVKEDPVDFALWKAKKPGEPFWSSPWGEGRPGWHIECSAMVKKYLGTTIDIHGGGVDLEFPHHENEIAQSECANSAPLANFWMHNGFINNNNQKMSKSLGNFFTVREIADKHGYETIRYFILASHYRSPINYSQDILEQCRASIERLKNCYENLEFLLKSAAEKEITAAEQAKLEDMKKFRQKFIDALSDDFNTADAVAAFFELTRSINSNSDISSSAAFLKQEKELFEELNNVIRIVGLDKKEILDSEIEKLIEERQAARAEKNFKRADEIREMLKSMGITLEDTKAGVKYKRN